MSLQVDIIIVGGGLVGAGLALALQSSGVKIALIDARLPSANDPRLFAMNYGSCQFLTNLGLWPLLANHAAAIHQVHVSIKGRFGAVRLNREEVQLTSLGHVIPANHIEAAINDALAKCAEENRNIQIFRPATVKTIQQYKSHADVTLISDNQSITLQAKIIIGADGTISTVREQAGIPTEKLNYQQSAIVTKTQLQRSHKQVAYERFTEHGTIAMLPLTNNQCATIWTGNNDIINNLSKLSDELFLKTIQQEFGYRLGRFMSISTRHQFPLQMVRAKTNWQQHILLIGNAAHTLHPVAAQGFNLALYEVAVLADYVHENLNTLSAENMAFALKKAAKQETVSTNVSHYLSDIFMERSKFATVGLQLGMASFDTLLPIKKKFIEQMTGRSGRVPRLLIGAID